MNLTFGIVTYSGHGKLGHKQQCERLNIIVKSIMDECPDETYEIIVVGDYVSPGVFKNTRIVGFDETIKPGWITRKKNLITEHAMFDNIIYMHDYFKIMPGFYEGWRRFGVDWDVAMNVIMNTDGTRYRDWCTWDDPDYGPPWMQFEPFCGPAGVYRAGTNRIPGYDYNKTHHMYISGGYWVAKKRFMEEYPLDERWTWGQAEDIEWSDRIREVANYRMNTMSAVQLLKYKEPVLKPIDPAHMTNEYITKDLV